MAAREVGLRLLPTREEEAAGLPSATPSRGFFLRSGIRSGALASRATPARVNHIPDDTSKLFSGQVKTGLMSQKTDDRETWILIMLDTPHLLPFTECGIKKPHKRQKHGS